MTAAVTLARAARGPGSDFTLYHWDAPDGTRWAARLEHGDRGPNPRLGWAVMQEDRYSGWVIVASVYRLRDVRRVLASDTWRASHGLHDPMLPHHRGDHSRCPRGELETPDGGVVACCDICGARCDHQHDLEVMEA